MGDFRKIIEDNWEKYKSEKANEAYPNILLLGISGAGKSSLINKIFNKEIAKISNVRPETQGFNFYKGKDNGLEVNLVDSAGYELTDGDMYTRDVVDLLKNGKKFNGETEFMHVVWYCIPITNKRIEDMDTKVLKDISKLNELKNRLCIVFTKCDEDTENSDVAKEFTRILEQECKQKFTTFETSTDSEFNDTLQLNELIKWSAIAIGDDDLRKKFVGSQMQDLELKHEDAKKMIKTASLAAAGVGAAPIPFSDSFLLVPIQVSMIGKIIDVYGVTNLAVIADSVIIDIVVSQLGKSVVCNLMKFIPGVGTLVGSTINATTAAAITGGLGTAISEICYTSVEKYLKGENVVWDRIFDMNIIMDIMKKYAKKS